MFDEASAVATRRQDRVEEMGGVGASARYMGEFHALLRRPARKFRSVALPDFTSPLLDFFTRFKLGEQEGGQNFRWKITRTDIYPGVLVYLTAKKSASIGSLLADNFGSLDPIRSVDDQRPPLTTDEIFCFMKTLGGEAAKASQWFLLIGSEESVGVILDHGHSGVGGDCLDRFHLAGDACVVEYNDCLGALGYLLAQLGLIDVESIGADIDKNRFSPSQGECTCRCDKCKRGDDDFITFLYTQQERTHFKCMGARGGEEHRIPAKPA